MTSAIAETREKLIAGLARARHNKDFDGIVAHADALKELLTNGQFMDALAEALPDSKYPAQWLSRKRKQLEGRRLRRRRKGLPAGRLVVVRHLFLREDEGRRWVAFLWAPQDQSDFPPLEKWHLYYTVILPVDFVGDGSLWVGHNRADASDKAITWIRGVGGRALTNSMIFLGHPCALQDDEEAPPLQSDIDGQP